MNVWVLLCPEFLTVLANQRKQWNKKGCKTLNGIIALRIIVWSQGSQRSTEGGERTKRCLNLGKWWPQSVWRAASCCWDQWLWLSTRSSSHRTQPKLTRKSRSHFVDYNLYILLTEMFVFSVECLTAYILSLAEYCASWLYQSQMRNYFSKYFWDISAHMDSPEIVPFHPSIKITPRNSVGTIWI